MLSKRKRQANRRNAIRSSDPHNVKDKTVVRHNALKRAIFAKEVVITTGDGAEDPQESQGLQARHIDDLQPVGAVEELRVDRLDR